MKTEDLFNYQAEAMRLLNNSYKKDKLSHAYLLDGEEGTSACDIVVYMAKKLLCKRTNSPCMNCTDCKSIDSNTNLNFLHIKPDGDVIKKEQIEDLIHEFSMTSFDDRPQIYLIEKAEKMNSSAQNSLLKFLEEPAPNHYAFLTTTNYRKLLDTIVSRCQLIHLKPVPKDYLINKLIDCGIEIDTAYIVSYLTTDFDAAMKYIEEGKITTFLTIAEKIVDKDLKQKDPYIEYYRNKLTFMEEKDKNYHRFFLDILILIYQELLLRLNNEGGKYFKDLFDKATLSEYKPEEIIRKLELLNSYQERFNYNVNLDLQYASLFSKL